MSPKSKAPLPREAAHFAAGIEAAALLLIFFYKKP